MIRIHTQFLRNSFTHQYAKIRKFTHQYAISIRRNTRSIRIDTHQYALFMQLIYASIRINTQLLRLPKKIIIYPTGFFVVYPSTHRVINKSKLFYTANSGSYLPTCTHYLAHNPLLGIYSLAYNQLYLHTILEIRKYFQQGVVGREDRLR